MIIELKFQHTYKFILLNLHISFFWICYFGRGGVAAVLLLLLN